jgi:uncharacterized protein YcbX
MQVARIGFTPVKGGRHRAHDSVSLSESGPVGDRAFCLIDLSRDRCLRTVENPSLLQVGASWDGTVLSVDLPSGTVSGAPTPSGVSRRVDYWGRDAVVSVVDGPWAAAYSSFLGRPVVLASCPPGAVVYGAPVSLVTGSSVHALASSVGAPVDGARFRATFEVDTSTLPPYVEDGWVGRRVRLGSAEVLVRRVIPRCAVIDLDPVSGARDLPLLTALAGRGPARGTGFGVDAVVTVPGQVLPGDEVRLG